MQNRTAARKPSAYTARYRTTNLFEASYLLTTGLRLVGKERGERGLVALLFEENSTTRRCALDFYNGAPVSAKALADAYRSLKHFVFEAGRSDNADPSLQ